MDPHEKFLELCALSTSGELTPEEQDTLAKHLTNCAECRKALQQFETVVDRAIPPVADTLGNDGGSLLDSTLDSTAEARLFQRVSQEQGFQEKSSSPSVHRVRSAPTLRTRIERLEFYVPYAAGILLIVAVGILLFRKGEERAALGVTPESKTERTDSAGQVKNALQQGASLDGAKGSQVAEREKMISELRRQIQQQTSDLASLRAREQKLQIDVQASDAERNRVTAERDSLLDRTEAAQASLSKMQKDLDAALQARTGETLHSATLEAKLVEASKLLGDREKTIGQLQSLLDHDRDIRELMGARDLYIAEVFDVARSGEMQKPYGRVFLTKGKSLIFYAYDLDEAPGTKIGATFQAWGSLGADRQQARNLGIFYEDNASKKRWVVRSDDAKALKQIEAVFVTVEPRGGSDKPSGKPFLFAYLRADANHP